QANIKIIVINIYQHWFCATMHNYIGSSSVGISRQNNLSPSPTPYHRKASSRPAVAELRHKTAGTLQYSPIFFSNSFVLGPVVIQPDLSTSVTASIVSLSTRGGANGIISLLYQKIKHQ